MRVRVCGCEGVCVRVYTAHHQQTHYTLERFTVKPAKNRKIVKKS